MKENKEKVVEIKDAEVKDVPEESKAEETIKEIEKKPGKIEKAKQWAKDHSSVITLVFGIAIGIAACIGRGLLNGDGESDEDDDDDDYVYDFDGGDIDDNSKEDDDNPIDE